MRNTETRIALLESAARRRGYTLRRDTTCGRLQLIVPSTSASTDPLKCEGRSIVYSFSVPEAEAFLSDHNATRVR